MDYILNNTKRNNIIICSSFLILYFLILGLAFLFKDTRELDIIENSILSILFIIAYGYLLFIFVDYFKHYTLKVLKNITLIILIGEILNQVIKLINSFNPVIPHFIFSSVDVIIILSQIVWIIFLFRLKVKDYAAMQSLRRYAFAIIASFILSVTISVITMFSYSYDYVNLMYLPLTIPYIFTIDFAIKLNTTE
jgi:hypothetical protein